MTLAKAYFQNVLSPWVPGVSNPIPDMMAELGGSDRTAIDVGCGPGILVALLAQHFGTVVALDRDRAMLEATEELIARLSNQGARFGHIELRHADWADCDDLRDADLVCAVNSILETDPHRRVRMLGHLRQAIRGDGHGTLLAVFPAMEAQVHLFRLYARALEAHGLEGESLQRVLDDEFRGVHSFDPIRGTFASEGAPPQKFVYELELRWELADAGFLIDRLAPIIYPWDVCRQVDAGYFPGEVELFDWFVAAHPR